MSLMRSYATHAFIDVMDTYFLTLGHFCIGCTGFYSEVIQTILRRSNDSRYYNCWHGLSSEVDSWQGETDSKHHCIQDAQILPSGLSRKVHWLGFPGGKVDPTDYGPYSALLREVKEELDITPINPLCFTILHTQSYIFYLFRFSGWIGKLKLNHEHCGWQWHAIASSTIPHDILHSNIQMMRQLQDSQQSWRLFGFMPIPMVLFQQYVPSSSASEPISKNWFKQNLYKTLSHMDFRHRVWKL